MWSYKRCGPIVGWSLNKSLLGINFPRCAHSCPSIQLWFAPSYFPYYISTYDWSVTFRLSVGSEAAIDTLSPLSSYLWQNTESQCSNSQSTSRSPSSSEGAVHFFFFLTICSSITLAFSLRPRVSASHVPFFAPSPCFALPLFCHRNCPPVRQSIYLSYRLPSLYLPLSHEISPSLIFHSASQSLTGGEAGSLPIDERQFFFQHETWELHPMRNCLSHKRMHVLRHPFNWFMYIFNN